MGKFFDALKAAAASSSPISGADGNVTAAMDAAIASADTADVTAALAHCTKGPYELAVIEAFHSKAQSALTSSSSSSSGGGAPSESNQSLTAARVGLLTILLAAKEALAEYHTVERDDTLRASQILQPFVSPKEGGGGGGANLGGSVPDSLVIRATVKLIELYCYASQFGQAEPLMGKCARYLRYNADDGGAAELKTRFVCSQAQISESRRRFAEAAQRFHEVSQQDASQAGEALQRSAVCALLAEPSDARSRMLGALVADERSPKLLGVPLFGVLTKASRMRFLLAPEAAIVKEIVAEVAEAHVAAGSGSGAMGATSASSTTLEAALTAHNVFAVSRVYYNIGLSELAALVGASSEEGALRVAVAMISAGRMAGSVNQVAGLVSFHVSRDEAAHRADAQIAAVCNAASNACDIIRQTHPALQQQPAVAA